MKPKRIIYACSRTEAVRFMQNLDGLKVEKDDFNVFWSRGRKAVAEWSGGRNGRSGELTICCSELNVAVAPVARVSAYQGLVAPVTPPVVSAYQVLVTPVTPPVVSSHSATYQSNSAYPCQSNSSYRHNSAYQSNSAELEQRKKYEEARRYEEALEQLREEEGFQ